MKAEGDSPGVLFPPSYFREFFREGGASVTPTLAPPPPAAAVSPPPALTLIMAELLQWWARRLQERMLMPLTASTLWYSSSIARRRFAGVEPEEGEGDGKAALVEGAVIDITRSAKRLHRLKRKTQVDITDEIRRYRAEVNG